MRPLPFLYLLALFCFCLPLACGGKKILVSQGPHRAPVESSPIRVKMPPPPARVEAMPLRRNKRCFYRDGYWSPEGSSWQWQKGDWVLPPKGCYYAPPQTRYEVLEIGTTLVHRPGVWHPLAKAGVKCTEVQACPAANAGQ